MEVKLLREWGDHKKGAVLDILDETVIQAGLEAELFEQVGKESKGGKKPANVEEGKDTEQAEK